MQKISLITALLISSLSAETITLYSDPKTGQVFTTPAEGRIEMGDFIDAKNVDMQLRDQESKLSEYQDKQSKYVNIKSKAKTIEFSGTHYFGFTSSNPKYTDSTTSDSAGFELRRNYLQTKAYFNDTDFFRITLDSTKELGDNKTTYANMYVKYAYLYLNEILPSTGVEIGIAHRPWIDYEEHNSWFYRSIDKVALESKASGNDYGPDLINSADLGFNIKTKTDSFSSEIGVFNGEGYHSDKAANNQQNSKDLSLEWRLTGNLIGNGSGKKTDTYLNLSTYGLISNNHKDNNVIVGDSGEYNRNFEGIHIVYNQPEFLLAGQYYRGKDDFSDNRLDIDFYGYSFNGEYRPFDKWTLIGRYDYSKKKTEDLIKDDTSKIEYGLAYQFNKNISFIGSSKHISGNDVISAGNIRDAKSKDIYMITTEVNW